MAILRAPFNPKATKLVKPRTLASIVITGPSTISEGTSKQYFATGTYTNGDVETINNGPWIASEGSIFNGLLSVGSNTVTGDNRTIGIYMIDGGITSNVLNVTVQDTTVVPTNPGDISIIPYDVNWAYQNDTSKNNFDQLLDGSTSAVSLTPTDFAIKNMLNITETYFTMPESMDVGLHTIKMYDSWGGGSILYIDLLLLDGTRHRITSDHEGKPHFDNSRNTNWWVFTVPTHLRKIDSIIFSQSGSTTWPAEIQFIGTWKPYVGPNIPVVRVPYFNTYGTNSFPWDNSGKSTTDVPLLTSRYDHMGWNRAYDDWYLFEFTKDDYRFAPTHTGSWDQDRGFARLKAKGVKNIQDFKRIPDWLLKTYPQGSSYRDVENAHMKYKGNLVFYLNKDNFPLVGTTNNVTELSGGVSVPSFPFTLNQPTTFVDNSTKLCYDWDGSKYVLKTQNTPGVYFDVYTQADVNAGVSGAVLGKLWRDFNFLHDNDSLLPSTYQAFAELGFQAAARYGTNSNVPLNLVLTPDKKIGLNLIVGVEAGNEPDAHWKQRKRYRKSFEMGAWMSAFYDGHKGTLLDSQGRPRVGVKNADPNMDVYMAGIAGADVRYYRGIIRWAKEHRGYLKNPDGTFKLNALGKKIVDLPYDVVKYHQYTNSSGMQQHASGARFALPSDMAPDITRAVMDMKNMHMELAGVVLPVHIGELGYDVGPSVQSAADINNTTTGYVSPRRNTQGVWVVRDMLNYAFLGVNSLQFYLMEDPAYHNDPYLSDGLYATSGFFGKDFGLYPREVRPAAWYARQFVKAFGNHIAQDRVGTNGPIIQRSTYGNETMYSCWLPSMTGEVSNYTLYLPGKTSITKHTLVDGSYDMDKQTISINGAYTFQISETPCFIKVN